MKQLFSLNIDGLKDQFPINMKIIDRDGNTKFEQTIRNSAVKFKVDLSPDLYVVKFYGRNIKHTQRLKITEEV